MTEPDILEDVTVVALNGKALYELPICTGVELKIGYVLVRIDLKTLGGQTVRVPMSLTALAELHKVTTFALEELEAVARDSGRTLPAEGQASLLAEAANVGAGTGASDDGRKEATR